ncbi:MAG: acetoacetate decarboxylase family protein [Aminivibrio sp.]|jgi:acetoacetate decarboxylase|nr:acetoacetate decarboxylase family protein [Synergistaceae bacterium]
MRGQFRFEEDHVYKMPVHFGGEPFFPVRTVYGDMTAIAVSFETEMGELARIIPEDFEITDPAVNVQFANCRDVDWLSGGEYRLIQFSVPVRFCGEDEEIEGEYPLVIWENKACPIIGGREEDGMPKIFADIASERRVGDRWFTLASYECSTFLSLEFNRGRELFGRELDEINRGGKMNYFGWQYIPNLGRGGAALSRPTLYPQEMKAHQGWIGEGAIEWTVYPPEHNLLQAKIVASLAGLPVVKYRGGMMLKGAARLNVGDSRVLSGGGQV